MKNSDLPKGLLDKHFKVTPTYISLRNSNITKEDFIDAVIECLERDLHKASKLGDLLNEFRARWRESLRSELIPTLIGKGLVAKKTCENNMSLAANCPKTKRLDKIPDSHYDELRSLEDTRERGKLIELLVKTRAAGKTIPLKTWQEMVRKKKKETGQTIRHGRRKEQRT